MSIKSVRLCPAGARVRTTAAPSNIIDFPEEHPHAASADRMESAAGSLPFMPAERGANAELISAAYSFEQF